MATPSPKPVSAGTSSASVRSNHSPTYLETVAKLESAFPALKGMPGGKLVNFDLAGGEVAEILYRQRHGRAPGRCALLTFDEKTVQSKEFTTPDDLDAYLKQANSSGVNKQCRLWILEDLQRDWINVLGSHLGIDPLVIREQMNVWHYTDSNSIPTRTLPSMTKPQKSFTLRYYEVRALAGNDTISHLSHQMTFAVNRRRYERCVRTPPTDPTLELQSLNRSDGATLIVQHWKSTKDGIVTVL
jgi:hypothetical protein